MSQKTEIIFFGNGPLSEYALEVLSKDERFEIIFHAKIKEDLEVVKQLKTTMNRGAFGVLASFGVMIKTDILELFEPEGILNIHPSRLPDLRGASPIETAILRGDREFYVSVMKLVKEMDAGPIYAQLLADFGGEAGSAIEKRLSDGRAELASEGINEKKLVSGVLPTKTEIYQKLARMGAEWIAENLTKLPVPTSQEELGVSFSKKLDRTLAFFEPLAQSATELLDRIRAFSGFPRSKYVFFGVECTILESHVASKEEKEQFDGGEELVKVGKNRGLYLECKDKTFLAIDQLQPNGKKPMDAKSFLNGYAR